jgi:PilZ domain
MNNRHFTRVSYNVGASISFGSEVLFCNTDNVSLRGIFLKTDHDIPLNIPVHVTLYNSNQSSLGVNARVVRKGENGVGLKINYLDVNSFVQLRKIVTEFSSDPGSITQETFKMLKCIH